LFESADFAPMSEFAGFPEDLGLSRALGNRSNWT
jgi:hypothetical protein